MATPSRRPDPPLSEELFDEPYRFDFFQAVRLLERLGPDAAPVGRDGPPAREVVRFRAHRRWPSRPARSSGSSRPPTPTAAGPR